MNASTKITMLTGLLSLCFFSPAVGADFSGNLKEVSITDAQATNKPPAAVFTYTISGETVTFDASGSSDSDGSITVYKWEFGGNKSENGKVVNFTPNDEAPFLATLTVIDDHNGVAITSQQIVNDKTSFESFEPQPGTEQTWTTLSGTPNFDASTLGLSMFGAECLSLARAATYVNYTSANTQYFTMAIRASANPVVSQQPVTWLDSSGTPFVTITLSNTMGLKIQSRGGAEQLVSIISNNTTFFIKILITGNTATAWSSTDGITWANQKTSSGTWVGKLERIKLTNNDVASTLYFDQIKINNMDITNAN